MLKKKRFLIGGIVIFLAIGFLGFKAFAGAAMYYYKVDEVLAKGSSVYGENIRVEGKILDGMERQVAGRMLKFTISDVSGTLILPVVYRGIVPDTFQVGNDAVVEGKFDSDGVFQANLLMTKCPSKYEPEQPKQTAATQ